MNRKLIPLIIGLLIGGAVMAQIPISGLPPATLPLTGNETVVLVQNKITKQAPVTAFVSLGTVTSIAAGTGITLTPNPLISTGTVSLTAPVTVPLGGTGATSITGLVVGNGTLSMTGFGGTNCGSGFLTGLSTSGTAICGSPSTTPPGGADTNIQYNNAGAFGGSAKFTWTDSSSVLNIGTQASPATITPIVNTANGATLNIRGGTTSNGNGGTLNLVGGAGVGTNRSGGQVNISAGPNTGSGAFGPITLISGSDSVQINGSGDIAVNTNASALAGFSVTNAMNSTSAASQFEALNSAGDSAEFGMTSPLYSSGVSPNINGATGLYAWIATFSLGNFYMASGFDGGGFATPFAWADQSQNFLQDTLIAHATTDTNGFFYLGCTPGAPTGVPANVTGAYSHSVAMRYDCTGNNLYAYNGSWHNLSGGGGGGTPGGSNTNIQFNNSGAFGGDAGLTWNNTSKLLTVTGTSAGAQLIGECNSSNSANLRCFSERIGSGSNGAWALQPALDNGTLGNTAMIVTRDASANVTGIFLSNATDNAPTTIQGTGAFTVGGPGAAAGAWTFSGAGSRVLLSNPANTNLQITYSTPNQSYLLAQDITNNGATDFTLWDNTLARSRWSSLSTALTFGNTSDNPAYTFLGSGTATFNGRVIAQPTLTAGTYGMQSLGAASAARDIFQAAESGFSNGFTVQYDGTSMLYGFLDGGVTVGSPTGGNLGSGTLNAGALYQGGSAVLSENSTPTLTGIWTFDATPTIFGDSTQILFTNSMPANFGHISSTFGILGLGPTTDLALSADFDATSCISLFAFDNNPTAHFCTSTITLGNTASATTVQMPGLATTSTAQTGTLCWNSSVGNITVDTTTTCLISARRYKQNIIPLDVGLDEVMKLKPVSYELKPEFNPEHLGRQIGLVAEDVAQAENRLVAYTAKGETQGVRYQQLTALLVKAIQEQQHEIEDLKKELHNKRH